MNFIGSHCKPNTHCLQVPQHLVNTLVRESMIGIMFFVVRQKSIADSEDMFCGTLIFRQDPFKKFHNTVTDKIWVSSFGMCRKTVLGKGIVSSSCKVGNSIKQCAVEIEYDKFYHEFYIGNLSKVSRFKKKSRFSHKGSKYFLQNAYPCKTFRRITLPEEQNIIIHRR